MLRRSTTCVLAALMALSALSVAAPRAAHATVPGTNGKIAFTSNLDGRTEVYTVDADGSGVTEVTDSASAASPSWSPDGSSLAFAGGPDPVGIYTMTAAGKNLHRVTDGSFMTAWSGDGSRLAFVAGVNGSPDVFTVNVDGTNRQDVAADAVEPAWSPDGSKLAVHETNGIYVLNADGTNPTQLTTSGGAPSFSPDGSKIAYAGSGAQIWVMNANGSNQVALTSSSLQLSSPSWSPDGQALVVRTYDGTNYGLAVVNANGTGLHTIVSNMGTVDEPDWQPIPQPKPPFNGRITFTLFENTGAHLTTASPDGSDLQPLTSGLVRDITPSWSPDGSRVAFIRETPDAHYAVDVANADGSDVHVVIADDRLAPDAPEWSPDGLKLSYSIYPGASPGIQRQIWTVNADGTGAAPFPAGSTWDASLSWSPDGEKVVFADLAGIITANPDGTNQVLLTSAETGSGDAQPRFSPDGRKILWSREVAPAPGSSSQLDAHIWQMNADGTGQTQLTNQPGQDIGPRYSPDGARIVFLHQAASDGSPSITTMNSDGSSLAAILTGSPVFYPDWEPINQPLVPGSPSQVTATAGDSWANVAWTPPLYDGGGDLSSYTVTASPGGATATVPGTQTSATLSGLMNGTAYTFTVQAVNSAGAGSPSAPSNAVTPVARFNGKIAFTRTVNGVGQVFTANPDGTGATQITNDAGGSAMPSWSPDGTQLAIDGGPNPQGVYIINADGTNPRRVSDNPALFISWAPDGSKLAYIRPGPVADTIDIATVNVDGTGEKLLGTGISPAWTPDSKRIVFVNKAAGQLWLMNADGTARMPIETSLSPGSPSVSPDGTKVVFSSGGIRVIGIDGSNQTLINPTIGADWPRWSPDGTQIVYQTAPAATTNSSLAVMNVDGSNPHAITATQNNDEFPGWQSLAQRGIPSVPTAATATAGNASAAVQWTAPASNGAGAITGYMVTSSPGGKTATVAAPATQATVSGLTNGTAYAFTVHATNAYGDSAESSPSNSVTPAVPPHSQGGFVLDDWGGIHPFRTGSASPPAITLPGPYWPGQDVVRGIASLPGGGYVVDDWGGIHPYLTGGGVTGARGGPYWPGQDVVRGIALMPGGTGGYVLDDWGRLHPFAVGTNAAPPQPQGGPYWAGIDAARGVTILPDGSGGYLVDSWGGLHPFVIPGSGHHMPAQPTGGPYWPGQNVVRGVATDAEGNGGYVVDDWGGIHPFSIPGTTGSVPVPSAGPYWPGLDAVRGISVVP